MPTENRSSNTEMVSVPRELTEEMRKAWQSAPQQLDAEWAALLAAAPIEQHQVEPYGWVQTRGDAINHFTQEWDVVQEWEAQGFEFKAMHDHADAGEVKRLRAHLDVALKALGSIDKALTNETLEGIDHDEIVQAIHGDDWVMNPCTQGHLDVGAAGGTAGCYRCDEHITAETTREAFEQWNATHPPRK